MPQSLLPAWIRWLGFEMKSPSAPPVASHLWSRSAVQIGELCIFIDRQCRTDAGYALQAYEDPPGDRASVERSHWHAGLGNRPSSEPSDASIRRSPQGD